MLTLERQGAETETVPIGQSSAKNGWILVWSSLLLINGLFCLQVWITTLHPHLNDNVRPILSVAIAALSGWTIWRHSPPAVEQSSKIGILSLIVAAILVGFSGCFHMMRLYLLVNIALPVVFIWAFFGAAHSKKFAPAAFVSLFALPDLPEEFRAYLFIPLQHICTVGAAEIARLFIPITYSGHIFVVNHQHFDVAPSCSGLSMWACFLFAFAIWQTFKAYKPAAYVIAFFMDPILVVALNTVRLTITALVAFYQSPKAAMAIHSNLEFILVPLGLLLLWKVGAYFAESK